MKKIGVWVRARGDRLSGFLLMVVGAGIVWAGYRGVASSPYLVEELAYLISGGVGGFCSLVVGAGVMLFAEVRDVYEKVEKVGRLVGVDSGGGPGGLWERSGGEGVREVVERVGLQLPWLVRRVYLAAGVGVGVGVVVVGVGWRRASSTTSLEEGLDGVVIGVGGLLWVSVVLFGLLWVVGRLVWWKKRRLVQRLEWSSKSRRVMVSKEKSEEVGEGEMGDLVGEEDGELRVVSRESELFHSGDCPAVPYLEDGVRWLEKGKVPSRKVPCKLCVGGVGRG